jgi:hypothetical protein
MSAKIKTLKNGICARNIFLPLSKNPKAFKADCKEQCNIGETLSVWGTLKLTIKMRCATDLEISSRRMQRGDPIYLFSYPVRHIRELAATSCICSDATRGRTKRMSL